MSIILPPKPSEVVYNKMKFGYFGELGTGANAHLRFLQTALSSEELDSVTLIESIPGSETWDVRDLFQRDVDKERVTKDILPYLKDKTKVKFFNPLTLALLPLAANGQHIERALPFVEPADVDEDGHPYTNYEWYGHYKFGCHKQSRAFSYLHWNDARVRVVAIDGQHRLSALKRWRNEPPESSHELTSWTIPVVILGIFRTAAGAESTSFLDVVRRTFVYINSTAKAVNEARETLLDDESVCAVCTQELIQDSHSNDCLPLGTRTETKLPLMVFDWRGDVQNDVRVTSPAALKTVEELKAWFSSYLLGEDGSEGQATALMLDDLVPPLTSFGPNRKLSHVDATRVRAQFKATLQPGLQCLLEGFRPYAEYIQACRNLEREAVRESDLAQHAFMRLRFGTSRASEDVIKLVQKKFEELVQVFEGLKGKVFDELLTRDIGMRGVISAFGEGKEYYDTDKNRTTSWLEYSQWFCAAMNEVYDDGWFRSFMKLEQNRRRAMTHVVFDQSGAIVNYKIEQVPYAFGAVCLLLGFLHGRSGVKAETIEAVWDDCSEGLRGPLKGGYRKQYRAELQDEFRGSPADFKAQVQKKANAAVERHLTQFRTLVW